MEPIKLFKSTRIALLWSKGHLREKYPTFDHFCAEQFGWHIEDVNDQIRARIWHSAATEVAQKLFSSFFDEDSRSGSRFFNQCLYEEERLPSENQNCTSVMSKVCKDFLSEQTMVHDDGTQVFDLSLDY